MGQCVCTTKMRWSLRIGWTRVNDEMDVQQAKTLPIWPKLKSETMSETRARNTGKTPIWIL